MLSHIHTTLEYSYYKPKSDNKKNTVRNKETLYPTHKHNRNKYMLQL